MLKFENDTVYILDNATNSVIYFSDLENVVKAFTNMNELSEKSNKYFKLFETTDDEEWFYLSLQYHDELNAKIDLFNTLFETDLKSFMIFTIEA